MKPSEDLQIDVKNINNELKRQAQLFYQYLKKKTDMKTEIKYQKMDLSLLEADYLKTKNTAKLKVKEIEALLMENDEILNKRERIIELEDMLEDFENVVKAMAQKHDCIKEISMNLRREIIE